MAYMGNIGKRVSVKDHSDIMIALSRNWLNSSDSLSAEVQHWKVDMDFQQKKCSWSYCVFMLLKEYGEIWNTHLSNYIWIKSSDLHK